MIKYRVPTLTIASSDSCGGAGIQADIKAFSAIGTYGMSVIVAITAQNTMGVHAIEPLSLNIIKKQLEAIFSDIYPNAIKIGMLFESNIVLEVAKSLKKYKAKNIILDPVMVSKSNCTLLKEDSIKTLKKHLIPMAYLVTPNIPEAEVLTGIEIKTVTDMKEAAKEILNIGATNVLLKGGHLQDESTDVLVGKDFTKIFKGLRIDKKNTHGTGCTLSSAITSHIALGYDIIKSIELSKKYISEAIDKSFNIGDGIGPVNHFYMFEK